VKSGSRSGLLRVLDGEPVWPPPLWLMRQAGRYLPEYRAVRAKAGDFVSLCTTPELAAEVTLQPLRRFGFDAAILFSDILILPWALGHGLAFKEGKGPVLPKLRDAAGLAALNPDRMPSAIAPVLEAVRRVRAGLAAEGHDAALIGFAGAPFTVACYMVEGGGSKDFPATRHMAYAYAEGNGGFSYSERGCRGESHHSH
jgi:uroporphyrinogen decarboxylase